MSWGTELWDQYDNLSNHTQKGMEFCERFSHYVKDRCSIETEYAAKLKRLAKNYQPKKKEEEDYQFTYAKGFLSMLNEVHDVASQHELISENMNAMLTKDMTLLIQELKQERKKYLSEGKELQKQLDKSLELLQNIKRQYEKAFKESEKAQDGYKQADANINLSRAEVERQKSIAQIKEQQCEEAKSEYASQLQKTNQLQEEHYSVLMPKVFQSLQDMDERRITRIQDFIKTSADIETSVIPIINTCIDGMVRASESVSPSEDSRLVVDRFKSGFLHPGDIPFEDLSTSGSGNGSGSENMSNSTLNLTPKNTIRSEAKGTFSGGKAKKRGGIRGLFGGAKHQNQGEETKDDYSHLPPTQQKKKLSSKIDQIRQTLAKETAEKDALEKMKEVYGNNPNFGDAATTEAKLEECIQKLISVKAELKKYEDFLAEADGKVPAKNGGNSVNRGSYSGDSTISSSASDLSVQSGQPGDHKYSDVHSVGHGSDQGSATDSVDHSATQSRNSQLAEQDSFTDDPEDDTLGMCQALYDFVGESDGTISMQANEQYYLIEKDEEESGWTRVRQTIPGGDEGYVPTTYLNLYIP